MEATERLKDIVIAKALGHDVFEWYFTVDEVSGSFVALAPEDFGKLELNGSKYQKEPAFKRGGQWRSEIVPVPFYETVEGAAEILQYTSEHMAVEDPFTWLLYTMLSTHFCDLTREASCDSGFRFYVLRWLCLCKPYLIKEVAYEIALGLKEEASLNGS